MNINYYFDNICKELPEFWSIEIELENGYGSVTLIDNKMDEIDFYDSSITLEEMIKNALKYAKEKNIN